MFSGSEEYKRGQEECEEDFEDVYCNSVNTTTSKYLVLNPATRFRRYELSLSPTKKSGGGPNSTGVRVKEPSFETQRILCVHETTPVIDERDVPIDELEAVETLVSLSNPVSRESSHNFNTDRNRGTTRGRLTTERMEEGSDSEMEGGDETSPPQTPYWNPRHEAFQTPFCSPRREEDETSPPQTPQFKLRPSGFSYQEGATPDNSRTGKYYHAEAQRELPYAEQSKLDRRASRGGVSPHVDSHYDYSFHLPRTVAQPPLLEQPGRFKYTK
eukprot:gb/GEZN01007397.1/.p1 GENE.gb/GEZN01007397.1/~~gb/GEZN01007397.1/.p1  ORF type:complete len:271 (+),score=22.81 gb/GEZN01007397.1/:150-962(+)